MAGRRGRKTLKSSAQTFKDNGRVSSMPDDPLTNIDLPTEILELILHQLSLRDNIRASAVCRRWLAVATSIREPNKAPWLMIFPKSGAFYEFYDPFNCKSDFHGTMRNRAYFSKVLFHGKRCVTYSPDARRYYPRNQNYDWGKEDSGESIWIDAPEGLASALQRKAKQKMSFLMMVMTM